MAEHIRERSGAKRRVAARILAARCDEHFRRPQAPASDFTRGDSRVPALLFALADGASSERRSSHKLYMRALSAF